MNKREPWIDRLKFLGILAIYIGHYEDRAGWLYHFVFTWHVPLFFFISGFFANCSDRYTTGEYIKKKVKTLVIPYFFLGLLNIAFGMLLYNFTPGNFLFMFKSFCGIRNRMDYFGAMWFFPCLFFVEVFYEVLYRIFKSRRILLFIGLILYAVHYIFQIRAYLLLSLDWVLLYFVYFALGSLLFPYIQKFNVSKLCGAAKALFGTVTLCSVMLAVMTFFQIDGPIRQIINYLRLKPLMLMASGGWDMIIALNMIFISMLIAKYWKWSFLEKLGTETLIFCGTEWINKDGIKHIVQMLGGTCSLDNPFQIVVYSMGCLVLSHFTITAVLKKSVPRLVGGK